MNPLLLLITLWFIPTIYTNHGELCTLTGEISQNPYPSLAKCYKYNNDACCTAVHDDYISSYVSEFLTNSCMRKYSELEDLMCLGCHPYESLFIDTKNKKIHICYSFAMRFWNATDKAQLDEKTTRFDNCGFKASAGLKKAFGEDLTYIIPSQKIHSFKEFIKAINVPFYENYEITLLDEEKDQKLCFAVSSFISISYCYYFVILVLIGLFSV